MTSVYLPAQGPTGVGMGWEAELGVGLSDLSEACFVF